MRLPIRFPNPADVVHEEATAYRRLSPTDRLLVLFDLIASGAALLEQSPHREASARLREAEEAAWRRAQKEFFARHAR